MFFDDFDDDDDDVEDDDDKAVIELPNIGVGYVNVDPIIAVGTIFVEPKLLRTDRWWYIDDDDDDDKDIGACGNDNRGYLWWFNEYIIPLSDDHCCCCCCCPDNCDNWDKRLSCALANSNFCGLANIERWVLRKRALFINWIRFEWIMLQYRQKKNHLDSLR